MFGEQKISSFQGIKGRQRKELDLRKWKEPTPERFGLLTKLHGSIDWKIQGDRIFVGDAIFTGDHEKQGIVYPGFKGRSNLPFFGEFHDYLEVKLSNATDLIFIGFAFRDEYISDLIRSNISSDARIVLINPDKSVKFPSNRSKKLKYIHDYFTSDSVDVAMNFLTR